MIGDGDVFKPRRFRRFYHVSEGVSAIAPVGVCVKIAA